MIFTNPIFLIPILTGPIFVISGWILLRYPPKEINNLYGYRTANSMKSQERWDFAQKYAGIEMINSGALLTLTSAIGLYLKPGEIMSTIIGLALMAFFIGIVIFKTEKKLKEKFGGE